MTSRPHDHPLEPARTGKRSRVTFDTTTLARDGTPPPLRSPATQQQGAPPPPPAGGPPDQTTKINSWPGLAKSIQADLKADTACDRLPWPCLRRFLLGGPCPCDEKCNACKKDSGKGADPCRKRAAASLAKLVAKKAIAPDLVDSIKGGERNRA